MWIIKRVALASFFFAAIAAAKSPVYSEQSENLGRFFVDEFFLMPVLEINQNQLSAFFVDQSFLKMGWKGNERISAYISVGQRELLGRSAIFGAETDLRSFDLVEAYGLYRGPLGDFRFGLQPVPFGFSGGGTESQTHFSRPLLFREGMPSLRDFGVSFTIDHEGYYTGFLVHNGESGEELDERLWYTAHWGYSGWKDLDFRISLMTGQSAAESTASAENPSTLTLFDINRSAQWRMGILSHKGLSKRTQWEFELYSGRVEQDDEYNSFYGWHLDVLYHLTRSGYLGVRYDYFEPDLERGEDTRQDLVFLIEIERLFKAGRWQVEWRNVLDQNSTGRGHQILFAWRFSSQVVE